jgi:hypothetical protein
MGNAHVRHQKQVFQTSQSTRCAICVNRCC